MRIEKFWVRSEFEHLCSSANQIDIFFNIPLLIPCQIIEKCSVKHGPKDLFRD